MKTSVKGLKIINPIPIPLPKAHIPKEKNSSTQFQSNSKNLQSTSKTESNFHKRIKYSQEKVPNKETYKITPSYQSKQSTQKDKDTFKQSKSKHHFSPKKGSKTYREVTSKNSSISNNITDICHQRTSSKKMNESIETDNIKNEINIETKRSLKEKPKLNSNNNNFNNDLMISRSKSKASTKESSSNFNNNLCAASNKNSFACQGQKENCNVNVNKNNGCGYKVKAKYNKINSNYRCDERPNKIYRIYIQKNNVKKNEGSTNNEILNTIGNCNTGNIRKKICDTERGKEKKGLIQIGKKLSKDSVMSQRTARQVSVNKKDSIKSINSISKINKSNINNLKNNISTIENTTRDNINMNKSNTNQNRSIDKIGQNIDNTANQQRKRKYFPIRTEYTKRTINLNCSPDPHGQNTSQNKIKNLYNSRNKINCNKSLTSNSNKVNYLTNLTNPSIHVSSNQKANNTSNISQNSIMTNYIGSKKTKSKNLDNLCYSLKKGCNLNMAKKLFNKQKINKNLMIDVDVQEYDPNMKNKFTIEVNNKKNVIKSFDDDEGIEQNEQDLNVNSYYSSFEYNNCRKKYKFYPSKRSINLGSPKNDGFNSTIENGPENISINTESNLNNKNPIKNYNKFVVKTINISTNEQNSKFRNSYRCLLDQYFQSDDDNDKDDDLQNSSNKNI